MATKSETRKRLEATPGQKPGDAAVQLFPAVLPVATYTKTRGSTTHQHQGTSFPNICYENDLLDVSSLSTTASNGQSVLRLTRFICPTGDVFFPPVNIVATPFSSKPCFLTITHAFLNNGADVEIRVFAWDANGAAAPNISFYWRCRVVYSRIFL